MKTIFSVTIILLLVTGCNNKSTHDNKAKALEQLTCESSREGRTKEELVAIGDACFRQGTFNKSRHVSW